MSAGLSIEDLDAAVAGGVIDAQTLARLQDFAANRAASSSPDEESFRLITGFNDIFVTIGIALFLGALSWLLFESASWAASFATAAAAWGLAEIFTRKRRMALPSIALLVAFVSSVFLGAAMLFKAISGSTTADGPGPFIGAGLVAVVAAALHWRRFHVPITIAAGYVAAAATVVAAVSYADDSLLTNHPAVVFVPLGLGAFALAMRFDMSDRLRRTRRTDIAFWLHLIAAPAIVHPVVWDMIHVTDIQPLDALAVLALFLVLAFVALVVDRRALMVSSLSYLIYAAGSLIAHSQWMSSAYGLAALAVGALVLLLSVAWKPLRMRIMSLMPPAIVNAVPPAVL